LIVLDSSAAVDYLAGYEPQATWVAAHLSEEAHAPHVIDVEVVAALRRRVLSRQLSRRRAEIAVGDLRALRIVRYPHMPFLSRACALQADLTIADGVFVALAEALAAPLVTTERRIAAAPGIRAEISFFFA
jgi:predicted nucleic acid-binding protein